MKEYEGLVLTNGELTIFVKTSNCTKRFISIDASDARKLMADLENVLGMGD